MGEPSQPGRVAPPTCDRELDARSRRPETRPGPDQRVEALPGHQPAHAEHDAGFCADAEAGASTLPLVGSERPEPLGVDPGRDNHDRQIGASDSPGLLRGISACRDDDIGTAQHRTQSGSTAGETAGHGDLSAVQHQPVRLGQRGSEQADRQRGVEHHEVGGDVGRERSMRRASRGVGSNTRSRVAHDPERLLRIPLGGAAMRSREDRDLVGRQSAPQLPEVRLDAADAWAGSRS